MPDKRCPHCGLWNLETALQCDCGYNFSTGTKPGVDLDGKNRASSRMAWLGLGLSLLGTLPYLFLAGFYLSRTTPAHEAISTITSYALLPGFFFGFIFGLTGITLGFLAFARTPRKMKILAIAIGCLILGVAGIIGNVWFYATCQFCQ